MLVEQQSFYFHFWSFAVCEDKGQSRCDSANTAFVQVTASRWHSRVNREHTFAERVSACKESTDASCSRFRIQLRDHRRPADSREQSELTASLKSAQVQMFTDSIVCFAYVYNDRNPLEQLLQYFS